MRIRLPEGSGGGLAYPERYSRLCILTERTRSILASRRLFGDPKHENGPERWKIGQNLSPGSEIAARAVWSVRTAGQVVGITS